MINRILVPTDGSVHANRAVDFACDLASHYGADLVFLHVLMRGARAEQLQDLPLEEEDREAIVRAEQAVLMPPAAMMGAVPVTGIVPAEVIERIGERILERAKHKASLAGRPGSVIKIKDGDEADCIVETVATEGIDTIVMGRRGLGPLQAVFRGSTSAKVEKMAECTCITVH